MCARVQRLGGDLKFVLISSRSEVALAPNADPEEFFVEVEVSRGLKCERCWHYCDDRGLDPAHPTICGRCTTNLYGAGETRRIA